MYCRWRGYAGINAVKAIEKAFGSREGLPTLRIILMDKHPYHLRKVLLFKPAAVENEEITVPLARLLPQDVDFIQATVTGIDSEVKRVHYVNNQGNEQVMEFDVLVLAAGSVIRQPDSEQGGIALTGLAAAQSIRETWRANLRKATMMEDQAERERLMTITVAGAGISGIETSAELAYAVREDVNALGLEPNAVVVKLINANNRLFPDGPVKVGTKLERMLEAGGVTVLHNRKVLQEKDGC
ncbi:FAD-dependent oxidoreductase [Paenibacillus sp. D2_2]|uniref:NAD(P)/FAD-dependent oxidoreductase n=1 Tax=Paenibacillus sp. D2_2 TaxID=3073092 RepID=UPI002814A38F|nr:FAD-dependent oxidoreductase [Paenibacillus sp. D2_2]WMT41834.1 FAD-dependent oxidoreductase [Paenibacillus sp. D2_2]